jgi:hypothetical protein
MNCGWLGCSNLDWGIIIFVILSMMASFGAASRNTSRLVIELQERVEALEKEVRRG